MKKIYVLWSIAIATLCANVFFACKADDTLEDFYRRHGLTMDLVKTPDFVVYSDGNVLSSTLTTKAETRGETDDVLAEVAKKAFVDAPQYASYTVSLVYTNDNKDAIKMTEYWTNEISPVEADLFNMKANGTPIYDKYNPLSSVTAALANITYSFNRPGGYDVPNAYRFVKVNDVYYLCLDLVWPKVNDGDIVYNGDGDYNDWIFKIAPVGEGGEGGQGQGQSVTDAKVNENYFKVQDGNINLISKYPSTGEAWWAKAPATSNDRIDGKIESVSQGEYEYVIKYLADNPNQGGTECNLTTYFIQNVGSSFDSYSSVEYPELKDWNNAEHGMRGGNQMDYVVWGNTHINDYNAVGGPRALCVNIPLTDPYYRESWGDHSRDIHDAYRFYEIEYNGETNLYLCFDYKTEKNSQEKFDGDGVYNDWVIKIIPAEGTPTPPDPPTPPIPDDEEIDEVEVNLSVNDEKTTDDYIATKLSIHIRALTDVEVFIPVARDYYCDVDDMAIVYSHKLDPNYQYSNPGENAAGNVYTYTYTVAGEYVKDGETFTANEEIHVFVTYEEGGIRVKTQGMTQAALDYLQYTYNDGITFEVWNYFNSEIINDALETIPVTRADLKPMFDQSTVTFTASDHPKQYVNAFAMLYEYRKVDLHVYMKDNKPYLLDVTTNAEGVVISETPTDNLLASQYWVANEDGTFKEFVGAKNEWDCIVSPSDEWTKVKINNGKSPANYNEIYTK